MSQLCTRRMVRKKKMRDPDFVLCVLLPNAPVERFKITDIHNFSTSSVEDIKFRASQRTGLKVDELDISYRGCILQNDKKISECDFKKGATIFVTKKKQPVHVPEKAPFSDLAIKAVCKALKKRKNNLLYRSYLEQPKDLGDEVMQSFMKILVTRTPGLINDSVALAFVLDPDMVENLTDFATAKRANELHPTILDSVSQIIIDLEKRNNGGFTPSLGLEVSLANLSDLEEMDDSQSSDPVPGSSSQNMVNVADAALLASLGEMPDPYRVESLASGSNLPPVLITPEMVSQAMQSAMASAALGPSSSSSTPPQSGDGSMLGLQLQQMQELGLMDIAANMEALTATGGDVQAAINILLSGGMMSDEEN